jgi:ATP-dependent RNA helicase DeaD
LKIVEPTEIQQSNSATLANTTDLVGLAKTGTGKTAALDCLFTINRYKLIFDTGACLVPTRELGQQILET